MELDEVDYRILLALQQDGRLAIKDVAKQANVSVPTARSRIRHLMDLGVIKRFTTVIDHQKLVGGVVALINLKGRISDLKGVGEELKKMDEVVEAYFTIGEHDIAIKVSAPDLRALEEFVMEKLSRIPGLEYTRSNLITGPIKEHYDSLLRPGYGVRIQCRTCKKEIRGEMVKVKYHEHEFFFCCTSCASIFKKEREILTKPEAKAAASGRGTPLQDRD